MSDPRSASRTSPRWYRSLYWRIGIGFVTFLVLILGVQVIFLIWMIDRSADTLPGRSPSTFADSVAADIGAKLTRSREADIQQYVKRKYAQVSHPFFVLLTDGRLVTNAAQPDEQMLQFMRNELRRRVARRSPPQPLRPLVGRASILLDADVVGLVAVPPPAPLIVLIGRLTPELAISGVIVLMVGTVLAATLIVRSPRRRLNALQDATARIANGDLSARAPETGQDEIAALARAFNAMAGELSTRAEQLRAADHARRQLLADMCHELSTPLTAIRGYVETLLMDGTSFDAGTRIRYLEIVEQETHRMQRRITDLLDLARLEAGGGILTIQPVSVAQLLHDATATYASDCAKKQITVTTVAERGAEIILGDPDRLEQVLQNLTANAIRHTPPGGRIEVRAATRSASVHITVTDDGEGIPPEHLPRVFDRFYKVDPSRAGESAGSGLGLSIAKAITERHGGSISVTSRPGETIFEVQLPLPDAKELPAEDPGAPLAARSDIATPAWFPRSA